MPGPERHHLLDGLGPSEHDDHHDHHVAAAAAAIAATVALGVGAAGLVERSPHDPAPTELQWEAPSGAAAPVAATASMPTASASTAPATAVPGTAGLPGTSAVVAPPTAAAPGATDLTDATDVTAAPDSPASSEPPAAVGPAGPAVTDGTDADVATVVVRVDIDVPPGMHLTGVWLLDALEQRIEPSSTSGEDRRFDGLAAGTYRVLFQAETPIIETDGGAIGAAMAQELPPMDVVAGAAVVVGPTGG